MFTIENLLSEISIPRNRKIIEDRLDGTPLGRIGEKYGITKSRIQCIQKGILPDYRLEEEKYRRFFESYHVSQDIFCLISGLSAYSYQYLVITTKRQRSKKNIFELWLDSSFDAKFKKMVFSKLKENPNLTHISGNERDSIMKIILQERYIEQHSLAEFMADYNLFLQEYRCLEVKPMVEKAFINKIELSPFILLSKGRMIRYYDTSSIDFTLLIQSLDFQNMKGLEYSTLKFYREHMELFKQYGICDEYEVHNLLRKLSMSEEYKMFFDDVYFSRMPIVKFGQNTSRKEQIINLIKDKNLSIQEATALYEEKYGIRSASLMAGKNIRNCIVEETIG